MTVDGYVAVRQLFDHGWGKRPSGTGVYVPVLAAAIVANRDHTSATVQPIAVVDFYAQEGSHDAQRLRRDS
ncbi:hypothetical protein [Variovorax paradoxus]|uniref:Uncharacterized protein n=1 Tax=Variovorax paradoxus TaxID=34073 RepID=A0A679J978_VARPD|nr:hypothetical protein VVAX_04350 [Variovorax paradoxus]